MTTLEKLDFYITPAHSCSYLAQQQAITLFVDPNATMDNVMYSQLSQAGFRRSGEHVYRPHCQACQACIATRIPVHLFEPNRQQRRVWQKNQDLIAIKNTGEPTSEHYALYEKYIQQRHRDGDMYPPSQQQFESFLFSSWSATHCYEFRHRHEGTLLAVAVVDGLALGLSAIYTFFDPSQEKRSLGTFAVLWEIEHTKALGLPYLYLGYWIKQCKKMRYKGTFRPLEMLVNNRWVTLL